MEWDPNAYLSFERTRLQPAVDLINRIPNKNFNEIADLGCGPGNVAHLLSQKWINANVTGYDSSDEMLAKAKQTYSDINWIKQNAETFSPDQPADLIFSNACLQWLHNHETLFPNLIKQLSNSGVFAIQMPNNYRRPTHQYVKRAAKETRLFNKLEGLFYPIPVNNPDHYYDILSPLCRQVDIWETDYLQELEGENPVADWTAGSYLRPFLQTLNDEDKIRFEQHYRNLILEAYPKQSNGKTLLPFKRLFILAIH
ncbi:methyltransferase domain-containing protein [Curvivirga aplysinae]|uniref:methyltransferase domain-containing protein n=1 Tax=Curvivirga aplysinae TaxID=2529852 RepID=UPI0012BD48ED|nr:methyltransferase domain-containing protein [Curvivirga aplysinae]MTI10879.1 methyltransferase domain-containing protein [Curvivirga aplysinae]